MSAVSYRSSIRNISDYSPFGVQLDGRSSNDSYRYGFQGQEKDDEIKGEGNSVNYKYRMHDPRVGRFFAVDPLSFSYPHYTPYSFSGNKVIHCIELEGLEEYEVIREWARLSNGFRVQLTLLYIEPSNRKESSEGANDKNRKADVIINGNRTPFYGEFKRASVNQKWENTKRSVTKQKGSGTALDLTLKESVESNNGKYQHHKQPTNKGAGVYEYEQWKGETASWEIKNAIVYHETNLANSGTQAEDAVKTAANALFYLPEVHITIEGNTSVVGNDNHTLSTNRANEMKDRIINYMIEKLNATPEEIIEISTRIETVGNASSKAQRASGDNDPKDRNTAITYNIEGL